MDGSERTNLIIALYTQAMEDFRHRVRVEWQTFAVVNVIYGAGIKILVDSDGDLSPFWAAILTIAVTIFTFVWWVRIYGNAQRAKFNRKIRNKIQEYAMEEFRFQYPGIIPPFSTAGGWPYWNSRELNWRKVCRGSDQGGAWPLWTYRGICVILVLYALCFLIILWGYRTDNVFRSLPTCLQRVIVRIEPIGQKLNWLEWSGIVFLITAILAFAVDKMLIPKEE